MRTRERWALLAAAVALVVILPALNALPQGSPLRVSDFTLNLFGKFLTYAILALGIDLIWGYTGVRSLGHGVFFGRGAYAMGMHLMLEIGAKGVYQNVLPDFMVWNRVTELPLFWKPFYSAWFTVLAVVAVPGVVAAVFGFLTFRSRIRGVYFSIITQALALCSWLTFNRNSLNLGGTNGLSGFKTMFGFSLNESATQRALYVGQVGIITPARIGVLPSIEMIIWVAVGGRGTLIGPVVGAFGVNWLQSQLTTHYPDLWILVLGGMFVAVVLFFPDGVVGTAQKIMARFGGARTPEPAPARTEEAKPVEAGRAP